MTTVSSDVLQQQTPKDLSVEYLNECFILSPLTGQLHWRERPLSHFSAPKYCALFNGRFAGLEVCDTDNGQGYRIIRLTINGKRRQLLLHRVVWALATGAWPTHQIDHKDTDRGHNLIDNLREATQSQNKHNCGPYKGSATGLKGVSVHRKGFTAYICCDNRITYLGKFNSPELAHAAYAAAATKQHGEFLRLA